MSGTRGSCTVFVNSFTDGLLDPSRPMLGPVRDGGTIVANTAPGCWGPMITPELKGGHEVTTPVAVEGAEPGDAIAIRIMDVMVTSLATASGNDATPDPSRFRGDPFVAKQCPSCGAYRPKTVLEGIGQGAVRCAECGAEISPFIISNGYTIVFDHERMLAVTLDKGGAERVAGDAARFSAKPDNSVQNPVLVFAPADLPGVATRMRPFMGQLGTTPSLPFPDSHNAGYFGAFLVGAPHEYAKTQEELDCRTDGHMDVNTVRAGAVLICPVKVPGGGVYMGDMHAFQGNGEIAGHTADVAGVVTLQVQVLKGVRIGGPVLLPLEEDLPYLAKPLSCHERHSLKRLSEDWGVGVEEDAPICFIGTGANMNDAISNGLERASDALDMSVLEVKNRVTVAGAIEIGRAPGVVMVTFRCPTAKLDRMGVLPLVRQQYGL